MVLFVVVLLLLIVLAYLLGTIGRIGLMRGTRKADGGAERLGFGELWSESLPFFWRVFGLSFLLGLAFLVILLPLILFGVCDRRHWLPLPDTPVLCHGSSLLDRWRS